MTNRRTSYADRQPPSSHQNYPCERPPSVPSPPLVNVIFTTVEGTLKALRHAGAMAEDLGAIVRVLVAEAVPYPLPLDRPPVDSRFRLRQFRLLSCRGAVELQIELRLCRDRRRCLQDALSKESLVVIGGKRSWLWPSRESRIARTLGKLGHQVVFVSEE